MKIFNMREFNVRYGQDEVLKKKFILLKPRHVTNVFILFFIRKRQKIGRKSERLLCKNASSKSFNEKRKARKDGKFRDLQFKSTTCNIANMKVKHSSIRSIT